ncbi:hypothetical protein P280DRAFT_535697 [Massarina eburnea CBS 473.64]|uniref:Cora-domain-containing protein n=1 Tax=Massarina eburnea CBS 473.64 TaxID=1395130 RepID=A0A6A6SDT0_9PLEO|nr:hypothetical protein P280DRAFT_535697 [Massarina eburnea CBS 473.64]
MDRYTRTDRIHRTLDWRFWPSSLTPTPGAESRPWPEDPSADQGNDSLLLSSTLSSHPELEDEDVISWGLSRSAEKQDCGVVDFCEVRGGNVEWRFGPSDEELEKLLCSPEAFFTEYGSLRLITHSFLNTLSSDVSWLPGNFSIRPRILKALLKAGLSKLVLGEIFTFEGSFAKLGEQCFQKKDKDGNLTSFEICYRAHCGWDTGVSYIQFIRTGNHTTYFCINYPSRALDRFMALLEADPSMAYRDFYLDALAADDAQKQWRFTIGQHRNMLLIYETHYKDDGSDYDGRTRGLHRLTRDWSTLNQDCLDYVHTVEYLNRAYGKYCKSVESSTEKERWVVDWTTDMHETFEVLKAQSENCARWTAVYRERANIRINLLFHLANQREARTSKQIAISTAKVAEQTQRDSAAMITMAAVTMLFLPGTFISTILSTVFFDFGKEKLAVSEGWWILPASTIPTTMGVFAIWLAWRWWRLRQQAIELKRFDVGSMVEEAVREKE